MVFRCAIIPGAAGDLVSATLTALLISITAAAIMAAGGCRVIIVVIVGVIGMVIDMGMDMVVVTETDLVTAPVIIDHGPIFIGVGEIEIAVSDPQSGRDAAVVVQDHHSDPVAVVPVAVAQNPHLDQIVVAVVAAA